MALTLEQSRQLNLSLKIIALGVFSGLIFVSLADGFGSIYPFINAVLLGASVGIVFSVIEFIIFTGRRKKLQFYKVLAIKTFLYFSIITGLTILIFTSYWTLRFRLGFIETIQDSNFYNFLLENIFVVLAYTFGLVFITSFTMQMSRKMGQNTLWEFITGAYYHPKEEERIIMFMSIQEPEKIIQNIGRLNYHRFLNDIFFDSTSSILIRRGEIYEYADNEMILIWKKEKGLKNANCVRAFFDIKNKLEERKFYYFETYGITPKLMASLHFGTVIKGEIGELKSEISYHGDPMNTSARILGLCHAEQPFLISGALLDLLELPRIYEGKGLGEFNLKGKGQAVPLFALSEKDMKNILI